MAKDRNAAQRRIIKLRNNKAPILLCHTKDCDNEYYIARFKDGVAIRKCRPCFEKPPQSVAKVKAQKFQKTLELIGLFS